MRKQQPHKHIKAQSSTVNLKGEGISPLIVIGNSIVNAERNYWSWGSDNMLPVALSRMNRRSSMQRALLNNKTTYCAGKKFIIPDKKFEQYIKSVNIYGQSLRQVTKELLYDRFSLGNQFIEIVKDKKGKFIFIYRQDPLFCRLGKKDDEGYVLLLSDWQNEINLKTKIKKVPLYPNFEPDEKGLMRSIVHIKEKEQGFFNYGVPSYIAGLQCSAILYKTDKWNLSRIDNSFNSSAIITVSDDFESDEEAENLKKAILDNYTGEGTAGKITVIAKNINDGTTEVEQLSSSNEGEWKELHTQAKDDLVIAHEWFRSLVGIADNTGFDTKRILNEYQIALNTVITNVQSDYIELYQKLFQNYFDVEDLEFENKPPVNIFNLLDPNMFVKKGEARRMAGLEVDDNDSVNNEFVKKEGSKPTEGGQI